MEPPNLRVVIFKGLSKWVAQCLEVDIATQAEDLEGLAERLCQALDAETALSVAVGLNLYEGLPVAPDRYWYMWPEAEAIAMVGAWSRVPGYVFPRIFVDTGIDLS